MRTGTKRPWTVMLGLTGQVMAVGVAILLPLIYTDKLPGFSIIDVHIPVPLGPGPAPLPRHAATAEAAHRTVRVWHPTNALYAPRSIPAKPAMLIDRLPDGSTDLSSLAGLGPPGGATGIPGSLGQYVPPAPPPPKAPVAKRADVAPPAPLRVSKGVQEAKLIRRVMPVYPVIAREARISGTVELLAVVGRDGTIEKLQVISGHPLLVQAALDAVRQWVYRPTLLNGEPVAVMAPIFVRFTLDQ
jgi:periplasmic protein TonB